MADRLFPKCKRNTQNELYISSSDSIMGIQEICSSKLISDDIPHYEISSFRQFMTPDGSSKIILPQSVNKKTNDRNFFNCSYGLDGIFLGQDMLHENENRIGNLSNISLESIMIEGNEYRSIRETPLTPFYDIHDYGHLAELLGAGDYFNREVDLQPTTFPGLSAEYAEKIRSMEKSLTAAELTETLRLVRVGPLLTGIAKLGAALVDKTKQPTKQVRDKAEQMVSVYLETADAESVIGQLLGVSVSPVNIYDPFTEHCRKLNAMLNDGGACTAVAEYNWGNKELIDDGSAKQENPLHNSPADLMAQDSLHGGSIHFEVRCGAQASYNRMYVAVGPDGKPFLFHDVIESGNHGLTSPETYLTEGKGSLLMSSFAAAITIANRVGVEKVAFGDDELLRLAQLLGFGEQRVFGEGTNLTQKLGYACVSDHFGGPYAWRMGGGYGRDDKNFRTVMTRSFEQGSLDNISLQSDAVMERIRASPRAVNAFRTDYETYFGMVREVLEVNSHPTDDLDAFCEEYKLTPRPLVAAAVLQV